MSFVYRGTSSDTMHFNVTERQVYNAPAFDVNTIEVPGRSGDVLNSQNRFKNKTIVYTGFLREQDFPGDSKRARLSRGLRNLKAWICGDPGKYHDLTDDYDPGFVRRAFVSGETAINEILDQPDGVTITVTFYAEPFMYEATNPIEVPEGETVGPADIATFNGVVAPLQSLIFGIEPSQDLHGYDYPWPAGGGKNLCPPLASATTVNGVTYTPQSDGSIKCTNTATGFSFCALPSFTLPAGTYTLTGASGWGTGANPLKRLIVLKGGGAIATDYGNGSNFTLTEESVVNVRIDFGSGATTGVTAYPMVRLASDTDATYAPYSNICPISGWTQCDGKQSGADTSDYTNITVALGQTVYGGELDVLSGKCYARPYYSSYSGQTLVGPWISSHDKYVAGTTPTTGAQVVDMGGAVTEISVTAQSVSSLLGTNNIWVSSGQTTVTYNEPTENPTEWPSKPLLEITMSGAGTLTVNGKTWTIGAYTGTLYCDPDIMDWYDAGALKNSLVSGDGFPEFVPGENVITYTGGITKVVATPRWRTL